MMTRVVLDIPPRGAENRTEYQALGLRAPVRPRRFDTDSLADAREAPMMTLFGSIAVGIMFLSWWLEPRSRWYTLIFAGGSAATAVYSGLAEVYPIMVIETLWTAVALRRFIQSRVPAPTAVKST